MDILKKSLFNYSNQFDGIALKLFGDLRSIPSKPFVIPRTKEEEDQFFKFMEGILGISNLKPSEE